jgi:hypothetical protein
MKRMNLRGTVIPAAWLVTVLMVVPAGAQTLFSRDLCAPGSGNIGHSWVSIPSQTTLRTPEAICLAVPGLLTVTQGYNDGATASRLWTYDCATGACSSTNQPIPEPGCSESSCFCVDPGDGVDVVPGAATVMPIDRCDTFQTVTIPAGFKSYLYSVPYDTFLVNGNDLARFLGLPDSGINRGTISRLNCATGAITVCTAGTASCNAFLLEPGEAYRISYYTGATFPGGSFTNATACSPVPAPAPDACPIGDLTFVDSDTFSWSPPAACPLPPLYDAIRGDLDCLRGFCTQSIVPLVSPCAGCALLENDDGIDSAADDASVPAMGSGYWYQARVEGGTWNAPGGGMNCTDWDFMLPAGGCP